MINKLNHKSHETAVKIMEVFQASYKIEAKLLGAKDFPPLKRPLDEYINAKSDFYGFIKKEEIAGIVEVGITEESTDIHSLVVHPNHFRQGIGKQLMQHILDLAYSNTFIVETGLDNGPATALYERLGFIIQDEFDTEIGIKKIRLIKEV